MVARDLLGRFLVRELDGERLVVRLVETEAYLGAADRAAHTFGGRRTPRNEAMYLTGGHAYVYFVYGMHFCLNVVTGPAETAQAVLLRAGEPVEGVERMRQLRGLTRTRPGDIAGGPARLCQALAVDRAFDAASLRSGPLRLTSGVPADRADIAAGPRIGVAYAREAANWPLRFAIRGDPHVSKPRL